MKGSAAGGAVLAAVLAFGTGCAVGPDFRAPGSPADTGYGVPAAAGPPRQSFAWGARVSSDWWTLFHCVALDELVKQAVNGNWSLTAARARMLQAHEAVAAAASALWPQLGVNASATREKLTAASFGLPAGALALPANFNLLQVGPVASYSLDLFGGARRRVERAQALADARTDEMGAAYLSLTGNVVIQGIALATLRAQERALQDILGLDRRNLDLVRTANRLGSIADRDVVSAQAQLAQDLTLLPPVEQALTGTTHSLAVLLGRTPGEWQPPPLEMEALTMPATVPVTLPSRLVHQRPDILVAEARLHAASAQVGIATAALYPQISLSAFANESSLDGNSLFSPVNLAWSVAAGLTQPVFDGHLRRSERREALAAYRASAADYQQTVLTAFEQVADLLQALDQDTRLLAAQKVALDSASHSVELERAALNGGSSGILGLLDAQRQYRETSTQYIRAQGQRYQDTAQLLVALGGGWWQPSGAAHDGLQ